MKYKNEPSGSKVIDMKNTIWFALLVLTLVFTGCDFAKEKTPQLTGKIESMEVESGEITVRLEETGVVEPIREINLKTNIGGEVVRILVEENDRVRQGQVIAEIEPSYSELRQINTIQYNFKQTEIALNSAREDLIEKETLFKKDMIPKRELDDAEDALELAELNYKLAREQFEAIQDLNLSGSTVKVTASASGTVIRRMVEEGEMVRSDIGSQTEGTVLAVLADLSRMIVSSSINEVDISKISMNQRAEIQVDAFPYKSYSGIVSKIAAMAVEENNVKVFDVEIRIEDPDVNLRPGMTANITIIGESRKDIVVIPIRAIFSNQQGQDIVYRVKNGKPGKPQPVKTGINDFQNVEIIEGLAVGDSISLSEPAVTPRMGGRRGRD